MMIEQIDQSEGTIKILSEREQLIINKQYQQVDLNVSAKHFRRSMEQSLGVQIFSPQQLVVQGSNKFQEEKKIIRTEVYQNGQKNQPQECLNGRELKIAEIDSHFKNWRLIGKVVEKRNIIKYNQYKTFCFHLEDSNGDIIKLQCKDQVCDMFFNSIQLEKYYIISGIHIPEPKNQYPNNLRLAYLTNKTDINEIQKAKTNLTNVEKSYLGQNNHQNVEITTLFFPNPQHKNTYFSHLQRVKKTLDIAMYSLSYTDIIFYLKEMKNVNHIRIIVDQEECKSGNQNQILISLSLVDNVYNFRFIDRLKSDSFHIPNKKLVCIINTIMTGSLNWSYTAFTKSNENVIIIENTKICKKYTEDFDGLWIKGKSFIQINNTKVITQVEKKGFLDLSEGVIAIDLSLTSILINQFQSFQLQGKKNENNSIIKAKVNEKIYERSIKKQIRKRNLLNIKCERTCKKYTSQGMNYIPQIFQPLSVVSIGLKESTQHQVEQMSNIYDSQMIVNMNIIEKENCDINQQALTGNVVPVTTVRFKQQLKFYNDLQLEGDQQQNPNLIDQYIIKTS